MEELFAYAIMLKNGLISKTAVSDRIDELFMENPTNEILLELEWEQRAKHMIAIIEHFVDYRKFNTTAFGQTLIRLMEDAYSGCNDLKWFASRAYSVWSDIPYHIQELEPFYIFCYADDPLSYGDEEQTRQIYESMFDHYHNK